MKQNLTHTRSCVYNINYHIVWSVKYRRKVLYKNVEACLRIVAKRVAKNHGFELHLFEAGDLDHIHCFVSAPPSMPVSTIVKLLKGTLGRKAFERFPWLNERLRGGVLWNPSYYVETVGSVSEDVIRKYIEHQDKQ